MHRVRAVIGRARELEDIGRFLDAPPPRALVIEAEAGAGKTALLRAAAQAADGTVLACWPAEAEAMLPFASLGDLLRPRADELLAALPPLQRRALSGALYLEDAAIDGGRTQILGIAVHAAVEALARSQPVLVVVDDVQWLDDASAAVLAWMARRLAPDERVRLLAARRLDPDHTGGAPLYLERAFPADALERLALAALDPDAIYAIVRTRLGLVLSPSELARVHEQSGGNPLLALELARGTPRRPGVDRGVPRGVSSLIQERLTALPAGTTWALGICAHLARPTMATLAAALDRSDPWAVLGPAIDDGVVAVVDGSVRFDHPLRAAAARHALSPTETRRVHGLLAHVAPTHEERVSHRARCIDPPDEATARLLERAAEEASWRGAVQRAAELAADALRFTARADHAALARRALSASDALARAGEIMEALRLVQETRAVLAPSVERARLTARAAVYAGTLEETRALAAQALAESSGDPTVATEVWVTRAFVEAHCGDWAAASRAARSGIAAADGAEPFVAAEAYATAAFFALFGLEPDALELMERARRLETASGRRLDADITPDFALGMLLGFADRLDEGRALLQPELDHAAESGDELARLSLSFHLAELEWRAGRWDDAAAHARRADRLLEQALGPEDDDHWTWWIGALIAAARGDAVFARQRLEDGLVAVDAIGNSFWPAMFRWALGFLELSLGDPRAALVHLDGLQARWDAMGFVEQGLTHHASDELEALIAVGREADAERRIAEESARAERLDRDRLRGVVARAEGMLASRREQHDDAIAALRRAEALHAAGPLPFDHARTLLALGTAQRRAGRRRDARASLERARTICETLGASPWIARAEAELGRLGGRAPAGGGLTPTEQRVAALVAAGWTNREVAAELVVSIRAVEANLTRIYAKLGLRSRAELAARQASTGS